LTSALEEGKGSASRPGGTLPRKRPGTHCTGGWVGLRAVLDRCGDLAPIGIRSPEYANRPTAILSNTTNNIGSGKMQHLMLRKKKSQSTALLW